MIRSMTGFGTAEGAVGGARVTIEVRSVNHRFFNPNIKLPGALARWESDVREAVRRGIGRGAVSVSARFETAADTAAGAAIDEAQFGEYVARLRALQQRFDVPADTLDLAAILRLPDVVVSGRSDPLAEGTAEELVAVVDSAVAALSAMREAEGERLAVYVEERLALVVAALDRIETRAPQRVVEQRDRLRAAVQELAGGVAMDEGRLEQEIAILADRLDVSEEMARFRSHVSAFHETIRGASGDGVGKRLGFLLQELLREANTTGSKANDAAVVSDVLLIKEELERIREQVENLE
ncbi:MAG TPA: YicC/YloC family endoribonuclease [Gemmatimonadaceae bacterium]|nr:YicC/YloC family endoribonuclease [Gemmatimonadaceae bacterium]